MEASSSDEDTGDNSRREKQEKAAIEELDKKYIVNEEMEGTFYGIYNKSQAAKYGTKKNQEELAPFKSQFIQLDDKPEEQSNQEISDSGSRTDMSRPQEDQTVVDNDTNNQDATAQGFMQPDENLIRDLEAFERNNQD